MTAWPPSVPERALCGHLRLRCATDERGKSFLREQAFSVPFHLSKPFHDAGVLVVNIANPTAGLLRGDRTESDVHVEQGARLLLTTPSAARIHDTTSGQAETHQRFTVATRAWLEIFPEMFIPQGGARHRQVTSIEVAPGGELLYTEMLAPGRVARGEIFEFVQLDWALEIRCGGQLAARERFALVPARGDTRALQRCFQHPYIATTFVITDRLKKDAPCWKEIHALHGEGLWAGSSRLNAGGWVIRMIAASSERLRTAVREMRAAIYRDAGWPWVDLRKL